jgi:hypothetical protein
VVGATGRVVVAPEWLVVVAGIMVVVVEWGIVVWAMDELVTGGRADSVPFEHPLRAAEAIIGTASAHIALKNRRDVGVLRLGRRPSATADTGQPLRASAGKCSAPWVANSS